MIIYVDIDETICTNSDDRDYAKAQPIEENIQKINKLFEKGHRIVYWTARGSTTGINWLNITEKQLNDWGAKFNDISVGNKPHFDLLIDDKAKRIEEVNFEKLHNM